MAMYQSIPNLGDGGGDGDGDGDGEGGRGGVSTRTWSRYFITSEEIYPRLWDTLIFNLDKVYVVIGSCL